MKKMFRFSLLDNFKLFLLLFFVFVVGCTWGGMPPSPDDPDGSPNYGGTANPGYVEPMYPLGDAGIFPKDDPQVPNISTTPEKIDTDKKINENEKVAPIPNTETKPDSPTTAPVPDNNKPDDTLVLFNVSGQEELFVRTANLIETIPTPVWAVGFALEQPLHVVALPCSALWILKRLEHNDGATTSPTSATEKKDNKTQTNLSMNYLIDDLVDQVDEYIKRIGDNLEELKTSENYLTDRDSVYRDASGLMLVVLSIGLSDKESRYRAAAPEVLVVLKRLVAAADHKSASSEFEAVKAALGKVGEPSKLKLEKVVKLKPVMKAMPNLNSNVRRLTNTETKLKRQLDKNPKQIFGQLAALAAISECSIPNADETSKPNELTKWRSECEQFRNVAIKANTAAHDFAKGKIKYESYWSAFNELTRSCDSCHRTFYPDAVGSGN